MKLPEKANTPQVQRRFGTLGVITLLVVLAGVYRWAEPSNTYLSSPSPSPVSTVTMRLENAPFESYVNGHKSWSVWANRIDLERTAGASMSMIQSASIEGIRNGILYKAGEKSPASDDSSVMNKEPALVSFSAQKGRYAIQNLDSMPLEWSQNYTMQWQFRLTDDVKLETLKGETLTAESMTLYELINRRTRKSEHRLVWDSGADMTSKKVRVHSNQMRMDPGERVLECTHGVRCAYPDGAVQTDRAYLSLKEQILRCPDPAAGTEKKLQYSAEGLVVNIKNRVFTANRVQMKFPVESAGAVPRGVR